jgi:vacuolar-type H+-ATPase subunit E/Vma4
VFEKIKGKIGEIKEESQRRREERARLAKERAEEEARKERERIQVEKDALMALSEKELMVEAIIALRGYNTRLINIEEHQDKLANRVGSLESNVSSLESSVSSLKAD